MPVTIIIITTIHNTLPIYHKPEWATGKTTCDHDTSTDT